MRTFIAVEIPEAIKPKILAVQKKIEATGADIKLVEAENLHYILKFIGEIDDQTAEKAKNALSGILYPAFDVHIASAGAFPSKTYIRVVWLGCREGTQELTGLAATVEDALAGIVPKDERPFTPHLTLGRVRSVKGKEALTKLLQELEKVDIGRIHVDKLVFFESHLSPKGPTYKRLLTVSLKSLG
jgi:2'-5' RNA ligase